MSERDFYEGADYAVKCGALTDTEAFNAVCDDLAKAHTEIERLRLIINTVHPQMQARIDKLEVELVEAIERGNDWCDQAQKARAEADAARLEGLKAARIVASKRATSRQEAVKHCVSDRSKKHMQIRADEAGQLVADIRALIGDER